jgi:AraC-like DNA-binding protein
MPHHAHDYIELLYARVGEWTVYLNFKEYKLNKGDVIFAFPGQIHSHEATESENVALLFPKNIPIYDGIFEHYVPEDPVLHNAVSEEVDLAFLKAANANRTDSPYAKGIACGYISLILGELLPGLNLVPLIEKKISTPEKLIKYCSDHYMEQITLESVAEALNYSPTHVSHLFRNKLQITFTGFITMMRIEDAKKMLRGDKQITQIAFDCGFGSVRTFNHTFKEITGNTPCEFRRKQKSIF